MVARFVGDEIGKGYLEKSWTVAASLRSDESGALSGDWRLMRGAGRSRLVRRHRLRSAIRLISGQITQQLGYCSRKRWVSTEC